MRKWLPPAVWILVLLMFLSSPELRAQSIENFRWLDQRQPSDVQTIVARALMNEPYSMVREIGYIGVPPKEPTPPAKAASSASGGSNSVPNTPSWQSRAMLTCSSSLRSAPIHPRCRTNDILSVYDVNQRQITATLLLRGPGLRLLGWLRLWREGSPELVATYDDCTECQRTTFFTTFHIDMKTQQWQARWPRSTAGAPIFSEGQEANGGQQVYALLDDEAGRVVLGTWAHFSTHGRPDTDVVYAYRVEYYGSHEATEPMLGTQARAFEQRLCGGQGVLFGLADGQDSALCHSLGITSAPPSLATRRRHRAH